MNLTATLPDLTTREKQVANPLVWGYSKKDVPDMIPLSRKGKPVSVRTVENITRRIYQKWGIQKATELTVLWFVKYYNIPISECPVKHAIITISFLLLFLSYEFSPSASDMRSRRTRRGRCKDEYEYLCESFDFTEPIVPII